MPENNLGGKPSPISGPLVAATAGSPPESGNLIQEVAALRKRIADLEAAVVLGNTRSRSAPPDEAASSAVSIIAYSDDLDRLLAAMNIAVGAASMGMEANLFFTFWATAALRRQSNGDGSTLERMMGWMLPKGFEQLKLSRMHMFGIGTQMLRRRMKELQVSDLDELFGMAQDGGVKLYVCDMSMSLLGVRAEDLIDYPDIRRCGVSTFLDLAHRSGVTLFI